MMTQKQYKDQLLIPRGFLIMARLILIILVALILSRSVWAQPYPWSGAGTAAGPFLIQTAEDMQGIGSHSEYWHKYFLLTADIDLSPYDGQAGRPAFNSIGNSTTPFSGHFDGNSHTISNFTVLSGTGYYIALFCCLGNSNNISIENLGLINPTINGSSYMAALVGTMYRTTIKGCYVE
ncbi:MAG: hypothetical protein JW860_15770 [Sedimentisphaerales bacterium]|nr:hypothetical protein [Sedimentisphaerales bacterium]